MNVKRIPSMLEISFWNFTIAILTESALVQDLVRWAYPRVKNLRNSVDPVEALAVAGAGLSAGLMIGHLASLVVS